MRFLKFFAVILLGTLVMILIEAALGIKFAENVSPLGRIGLRIGWALYGLVISWTASTKKH